MGRWAFYASTDLENYELRRKDEKEAVSAHSHRLCKQPLLGGSSRQWSLLQWQHQTSQVLGRGQEGRRCSLPVPSSLFLPTSQPLSNRLLPILGFDGMVRDARLGEKDFFSLSCAVFRPSCRESQTSGDWVFAPCWVNIAWSEVVRLVYQVPTCLSLEKLPSCCLPVAL